MGDPLTPNLPPAWKDWATSKQTLLLGMGVIVALNLYVCIRIGFSQDFDPKEKRFWLLAVWIWPALGGLLGLLVVSAMRRRRMGVPPVSRLSQKPTLKL
jgi:hypothetical protein